jgi:ATP-binding cassette subfamily B multidrug efflux pump
MLRLARYLKPFIFLILSAMILLFVQAMADLSLPDYMARIVNNGIQQGGIENAVPDAIRQSQLDKLLLFMSADEQAQVLAQYTLITAHSPDYQRYIKDYPALADQPVYVRGEVSTGEINHLNPIVGKAFLALTGLERKAAPETIDPATLPAEARMEIVNTIDQKYAPLGTSGIVEAAVVAIKAEYVALGVDTGSLQNHYIVKTGSLMLLLALLSAACTVIVGLLAARTAAGAARDVRRDLFQKVENFSNAEFDKFSTASLITRSTNDVTQVQMVIVMVIRIACYAPILGVGGVIKAMGTDANMWWIIVLAVVALLALIATLFVIALPKFKIIQSLIDRLNLVMRENLSGMMVVRAFNTQRFEEARFDRANQNLTDTSLFVNRAMAFMMPMMMIIMNGLSLLIIWVGAHQVAQSAMQVGDMIAFIQYAAQVVMAFLMLSIMFIILPRASVSGDRIADVLEIEPSILDPEQPRQFPQPFEGTVEFRHVSFRYPGAEIDVLHDLSFVAQPGQTTAFIGSTGSGKSTLINLIPRFYDVTEGAILVNGVDIREVTQHDLRAQLGYMPQKATLFSGTIESNLRYGDGTVSPDELAAAVEIAQASEFIAEKPEGLATEIAQGGANVSGGQRQRLSIARALVKGAPIYIFDDSFSGLDFKTDAALRRALKEKTGASTVLIVTQRVSTVMQAEQIIVLDEGKIVGTGTHRELLADCEIYREIAVSQLGMEDAA